MYSGGKKAREALAEGDKLTVDDIFKAARFLKKQNAPKINGSYVAIIHPDVAYDLMRNEEWVDVHKYSATSEIFEGEIGKIAGVRFVETTEAKIFSKEGSGSRDVYSTLVLGANAYGVTELTGGGLQHIVKQLGSAGTADPLNQRATAGWKGTKTAEILVESYMIRIESASTFNEGTAN
jgi:N4-gp56 family major capsid protein